MRNDDDKLIQTDGDEVGELIRAAGRRPAVPNDRAQRVKSAAHAHWSLQVARSRRRRYVLYTAALGAAAALALVASLPRFRPQPVSQPDTRIAGTVESVVGECHDGKDVLQTRQNLVMGSTLTTSSNGRIGLRLASGYIVKIDITSRLRLVGPGILALDDGAIYVDS